MSLKAKIEEDMKTALKSGDKKRLKVLRFLLAQIKNAEIEKGSELSDQEVLKLISKEIKKIEEAAEKFREGGSEQRALEELEESEILKAYLPEPLSQQELEKIVSEAIEETGANSIKDMGKVMKVVLSRVAGRADGKIVSEIVKNRLS